MAIVATGLRRTAGVFGRGSGRVGRRALGFFTAVRAVMVKESRGRMRGRRAFVVLSVYLLLLGVFAFGVYQYVKQGAATQVAFGGPVPNGGREFDPGFLGGGTSQVALSATIGHALFSGLMLLETLLVLVLAPAFTTGAISLEREKQTLELLVTTPLSTLGMVIGKLLSALVYVFLLILASIPFASIVFPFGGVGPEDLFRAYAVLFALAFGMGAIGLFVSALVRRTQTATVLTLVLVLVLTLGSSAVHAFWLTSTRSVGGTTSTGQILPVKAGEAPEVLLWLNPFVSAVDLICTTAPTGVDRTCGYLAGVTRKPYFGGGLDPSSGGANGCPPDATCAFPAPRPVECGPDGGCKQPPVPGVVVDDTGLGAPATGGAAVAGGGDEPAVAAPGVAEPAPAVDLPAGVVKIGAGVGGGAIGIARPADAVALDDPATFGYPRDTFWPHSTLAFLGVGVVLTLLSAQLVAPTRRTRLLRFPRPTLRRRGARPGTGAAVGRAMEPTGAADVSEATTDPTAPSTESPA